VKNLVTLHVVNVRHTAKILPSLMIGFVKEIEEMLANAITL